MALETSRVAPVRTSRGAMVETREFGAPITRLGTLA